MTLFVKEEEDIEYKQNTHSLRLAKFISGAGTAMLNVLEEDLARREGEVVEGLPQRDIDFADSITVLRIEEVRFIKSNRSSAMFS